MIITRRFGSLDLKGRPHKRSNAVVSRRIDYYGSGICLVRKGTAWNKTNKVICEEYIGHAFVRISFTEFIGYDFCFRQWRERMKTLNWLLSAVDIKS
jgi:hypothetical protein